MKQSIKEAIAWNSASVWCNCFKCDGIVNDTKQKCDKPFYPCAKWYDGYRTAMIALGDKRVEELIVLTWEDAMKIWEIAKNGVEQKEPGVQGFFSEVARIFNEKKI